MGLKNMVPSGSRAPLSRAQVEGAAWGSEWEFAARRLGLVEAQRGRVEPWPDDDAGLTWQPYHHTVFQPTVPTAATAATAAPATAVKAATAAPAIAVKGVPATATAAVSATAPTAAPSPAVAAASIARAGATVPTAEVAAPLAETAAVTADHEEAVGAVPAASLPCGLGMSMVPSEQGLTPIPLPVPPRAATMSSLGGMPISQHPWPLIWTTHQGHARLVTTQAVV